MNSRALAIAATLILSGICVVVAQDVPPLPAFDGPAPATIAPLENAARVQLERANALILNDPTDEVLEAYRRVIDSHGDRLILWTEADSNAPANFARYTTVRSQAWARLSTLSRTAPAVLATFRRQLDPQARRYFQQNAENQDSLDEKIVNDLFLSSFGDDALRRLGDSALERGNYTAARGYWEKIAPGLRFVRNPHPDLRHAAHRPLWLPFIGVQVPQVWPVVAPWFREPEPSLELVYPDSDLNIAEVHCRLAFASILEGNLERAAIEIDLLQHRFPGARGVIAGREGDLVELAKQLLKESQESRTSSVGSDWSTFAGSATRNRIVAGVEDVIMRPLWKVTLPRWTVEHEALTLNRVRVGEEADALLPYHPLILQDLAVIQTQNHRDHVQAYRLKTGEAVLPQTESTPIRTDSYDRRNSIGVPRFTLTADANSLFLLERNPSLSMSEERRRSDCKLTAIDLSADRKLLWQFSPSPQEAKGQFSLAGCPVLHDWRLFVVLRRREAARDETHVAAIDSQDGRVLWRQFVGAAEPATNAMWIDWTQQLLSVSENTLYCNTNAGLVAALEMDSGKLKWATSYPRSGWNERNLDRNDLHFYRDLNPCLVHRGVVVVAPTDCNRIFALDANNGVPLWVTPAELAADAIHLVGAVENQLVATGECVYWFDVRTGRLTGRFPEPFKASPGFARPSPRGYGRGILGRNYLYWPTREAILVIDPPSGSNGRVNVRQVMDLRDHGLSGGNLAFANGTLLIAAADRLAAFGVQQPAQDANAGTSNHAIQLTN